MKNKNNTHIRHAKGPFAMTVVYSFTGAAILASIIFSLLLFLSLDENLWMKVLFGSLAVIFELGKFFAWYEFGERLSRRNISASFSALFFYSVLAAISIGGSIGGINSATNTAHQHVDVQQSKISSFNLQITAIDKQIALNNVAAEKYIELNRIATGVARIQRENAKLRKQQVALAQQRDSLPITNQGSVFGLIGSIADGLSIKTQDAQLGLVIFLSVLLDLFAAFFVGLIGEELRFTRNLAKSKQTKKTDDNEQSETQQTALTPANKAQHAISHSEHLFQQTIAVLRNGDVRCSKKAVANKLKIKAEEVDQIFIDLLAKGFVSKKANHHFTWQGESA